MPVFKSELIAFRLKPEEKNLLMSLAQKEQLHMSELLRELVKKKLRQEKLKIN